MRPDDAWLSLTPEPERELPEIVAALRGNGDPPPEAVERERGRVERLVVRARRGARLVYLNEVADLVERTDANADGELERARRVAIDVLRNHDTLLKAWNGG